MFTDFVINGVGQGDVGSLLNRISSGGEMVFDPGINRPYIDEKDGKKYVTLNNKGKPQKVLVRDLVDSGAEVPALLTNSTSLRKQEWVHFDNQVLKAARSRLRAWTDLMGSVSVGGFNAMGSTTFEYEAINDPGEAVVDMDGLTDGRNDGPLFKLRSVPLPITHSDFWMSSRQLATSRNKGMPLSTTMPEFAARRVAERIEKQVIGMLPGMEFGTVSTGPVAHDGQSKIYGWMDYPPAIDYVGLSTPTGSNPDAILADVLGMRDELYDNDYFGPFMVYTSKDWDRYLDNDYYVSATGMGGKTLRQRLKDIEGIQDVRRLDFFTTPFTMIMIQMTSDVVRAINGMDVTTVQWETHGGMRLNFKVMAIQLSLNQSDFNGKCGILRAQAA